MKLFKALSLCLLTALLTAPVNIYADTDSAKNDTFIYDEADLLTDKEETNLNELAKEVSDEYNIGVYVFAINDFYNYSYSIDNTAETLYDSCKLGSYYDENAIMLVLSMADRDYDICAHGEMGNYAFTDYGKQVLANQFLSKLGNNDWYDGFRLYIKACGTWLETAKNDAPIDTNNTSVGGIKIGRFRTTPFMAMMLFLIGPGIISLVICSGMLAANKSVKQADEARDYLTEGGVHINRRIDQYAGRNVHRVHIEPPQNNRGGGGGGTSINSGGFSHSSGKF